MNYPGCIGIAGQSDFKNMVHPSDSRGVFSNTSNTRFRDITDGSSNTVMCGEAEASSMCSGGSACPTPSRFLAIWIRATQAPSSNQDFKWFSVLKEMSTGASLNGTSYIAQGFRSKHVGGAHFLFADGRVKFISDSIDGRTYKYIGATADGNVIGEF